MNLENIEKILVIKLRSLGDVLLATPLFNVLKKRFPLADIDAYVYEEAKPILEGQKSVSKIFSYDRNIKKLPFLKRIISEIKILRRFQKQKYDLVINLTEGDRGAIVTKMTKAGIKVGMDVFQGMKGKEKIYTHFVKNCSTPRHNVERNLDFLRRIGVFPEEKDKVLSFNIPGNCYESMKALLKKNGIDDKKFIIVHPSARWRFKSWPDFRMNNLVKKIVNDMDFQVVITGGKEEYEKLMAEKILEGCCKEKVLDLVGKISLKELGALVDMSQMVICVDSLVFHISSVFKKKCIALFGPTSEKNWGPWQNENATIMKKDYPCRPCFMDGCGGSKRCECLYDITEEDVFEELEKITT